MKKSHLRKLIKEAIKEQQTNMTTEEYLAGSECANKFYVGEYPQYQLNNLLNLAYGGDFGDFNTPISNFMFSAAPQGSDAGALQGGGFPSSEFSLTIPQFYQNEVCFFSSDQGNVTAFGVSQDDIEIGDVRLYKYIETLQLQFGPIQWGIEQFWGGGVFHQEPGLEISTNEVEYTCTTWTECLSQLNQGINFNGQSAGGYFSNMSPDELNSFFDTYNNQVMNSSYPRIFSWGNGELCKGCEPADKTVPPSGEADRIDDPGQIGVKPPDPVDTFGGDVSLIRPNDLISFISDHPNCVTLSNAFEQMTEEAAQEIITQMCSNCLEDGGALCNPSTSYACTSCGFCDGYDYSNVACKGDIPDFVTATDPEVPTTWTGDCNAPSTDIICSSGVCENADALLGDPQLYEICVECCYGNDIEAMTLAQQKKKINETKLQSVKRKISKLIREIKIKKHTSILSEQPSESECEQFIQQMDPYVFDTLCQANANNPVVTQPDSPIANMIACCPEPVVEPTPGEEGPCRRVMDDIIPNNYNSTGQEWCKKNCKDSNAIVMIAYGNDQINGCKCCGEFNIDQVGPVPQELTFSSWINQETIFTCEPGTNYAPSDDNIGTGPGQVNLNLNLSVFNDIQVGMSYAQVWCDNKHNNPTSQPYSTPWSSQEGNINPWIVEMHGLFQTMCCEGNSTFGDIDYDEDVPWPQGVSDLEYVWENKTLSESLVKRFKKLANIKENKK